MFNMWRAGKEVVSLVGTNAVYLCQGGDISCLSDRVAAEVDDARWFGFEKFSMTAVWRPARGGSTMIVLSVVM